MKTPHRIMYEVLTPEEYKNFCMALGNKVNVDLISQKPSYVLSGSFNWSHAESFLALESEYFHKIYNRLVGRGL